MKKLYTLLVFVFAVVTSNAQIVNIPDANFKAKLLSSSTTSNIASGTLAPGSDDSGNMFTSLGGFIKIDANNDGEIQASEALNVVSLDIRSSSISDLTGIEYFTNLKMLNFQNNLVSAINLSVFASLERLNCLSNNFSTIDFSDSNLKYLSCGSNHFASLQVSGMTNLLYLSCPYNQLTTLNVDTLINLKTFYFDYNQLTSINLYPLLSLENITFHGNQISTINLNENANIKSLGCSINPITSLDLSHFPNLFTLSCAYTQLTSLDVSNNPILYLLWCNNNSLLTSLFMKNGTDEAQLQLQNNPNLVYVCADESQITTIQGLVGSAHVNSYCNFSPGGTFYTVQGSNHYDSDTNGCTDLDINYPNLYLKFTTGTSVGGLICDETGSYHYDVQAGTHYIQPILENPTYFNVSPTTTSVIFPTSPSPTTKNFCITPNGVHNDLEIVLIPLDDVRPGYQSRYVIHYKNKGTNTQSGLINLSFNDDVLNLTSSLPSPNSITVNSINWNYSLLPLETKEISLEFILNTPTDNPSLNAGDVLNFIATITGAIDETPNNNSFVLDQIVVNSFDPNDKTCLQGTTITPSMVGQYVHYIIRFENTGTFSAQNIVIKDIINTNRFDINSLVPLSSSHSFMTRIINTNRVEFIFENINLPFDDANNDGYVAFKIKTKPTLVVGNTFSNSANIYFDYNFPITTNTYVTTVQALGNQDFEFDSMFSLSPVPTKDLLTITAKESVVMTSVNIYNVLGQLVQVNTNPSETIDVSGLQSGSYFIKIVSDKGNAIGKFIKE